MLELKNVCKSYKNGIFQKKEKQVLKDIHLKLQQGKTLGIVGESGCGKSTLGKIIAGIEELTSGEIYLDEENYKNLLSENLMNFRKKVQLIFQNPVMSFNPKKKMRFALLEPLKIHGLLEKEKEDSFLEGIIDEFALDWEHLERYPHQLSGGQLQRIALARVFSLSPKLIIADEPTSMLDVSVQANILNMLLDYQKKHLASLIIVSHDLEVIEKMSDDVMVMYNGEIVEYGLMQDVLLHPAHAYTKELIKNTSILL